MQKTFFTLFLQCGKSKQLALHKFKEIYFGLKGRELNSEVW